jgi:predicted nucleic acid-binding Zn ribbon protein
VAELYKRKPNTKCIVCKKYIYKRPSQITSGRVFCSMKCYGINCRKETPCVICGKPILSGLNKKTCSRACSNKNRIGIKYKENNTRDVVRSQRALKLRLFKERGVKCQKCGYSKYNILQVHHIDKNRQNNSLKNLELLCPNCHYEKHYLES